MKPNELEKLTAIQGDIMSPLLGISEEDLDRIKGVSIFLHSAATVRFDEPLRKAIRVNIGGTYESMKVAQTMKNLEIFAHVSTFYSNPYLKFVDSKIYPPVMDWKTVLKLANSNIPDEIIDILTIKYIKMFPNTYTFTKSLAEHVVNEHRHLFPTLIYRPSIGETLNYANYSMLMKGNFSDIISQRTRTWLCGQLLWTDWNHNSQWNWIDEDIIWSQGHTIGQMPFRYLCEGSTFTGVQRS